MNNKLNFIKKYYAEITASIVFIIYFSTLAPTVVNIDSGELSTVQIVLGIAHPTGYPLFTMLGYLWQLIPLPFTAIFKANLLASIFTSLAVWIFIKSSYLIVCSIPLAKEKKINKKKRQQETTVATDNISNVYLIVSASASGLLLAFSKTFWIQSTSVEVYSLHLLLINIVIYFLIRAFVDVKCESRNWFYLAVALALSFTNHLTTILILPGIAILFYNKNKFKSTAFLLNLKMIGVFIQVLVVIYLYLPIRASQNPLLNWGNPINFENLWRHFTGNQYSVWLFASSEAAKKQLAYFFANLPTEFNYSLAPFLILLGLIYSFRKYKIMSYFILITFISTVLYSINYDINDIDSYFLLAYIMLSFFAVFGFLFMYQLNKNKITKSALIIISFLIPIVQMGFNYEKVDQSNLYVYEDYTKQILNSVPKNSLILSYQWDYWVSSSYYFRLIENYRKDVVVVDKELLRRSWYYNQLDTDYPGLLNKMQNDVSGFIKALKPFERGEKFNPNVLEKYYRTVISDFLTQNNRRIFIAPELYDKEIRNGEITLPVGFHLVPYNYLFLLTKNSDYIQSPELSDSIRFPKNLDKYTLVIRQTLINMFSNRALYEMNYGYNDRAKKIISMLKKKFPDVRLNNKLNNLLNN